MALLHACNDRPKVGLFGGAFDPPHLSHQDIARQAVQQLTLDVLHIVPTGHGLHKNRPLSLAPSRLRMCELAFDERKIGNGCAQIVIDDRELKRQGASFTFDTLSELKALYPLGEFFLIIGQDQAQAFEHWHRHAEIQRLAQLVVAKRLGVANEWHNGDHAHLGDFIELELTASARSATQVREQLWDPHGLGSLIDPDVLAFIQLHGLYKTAT
jgi:nicotinate-nucleotide adenylyltransferase